MQWTEITEDNMDEVYNMDGNRLVIASKFLNEKIYRRYGEVSTTISTMVKIGGYYYMELPELNTNEQDK